MRLVYAGLKKRFPAALLGVSFIVIAAVVIWVNRPTYQEMNHSVPASQNTILAAGSEISLPEANGSAIKDQADLAFVQNGLLYILDGRTGKVSRLSDSGQAFQPRFSFDGQWLAYLNLSDQNSPSGSLWLVRRDGSQAHQVQVLSSSVTSDNYDWSPQENQLAVNCQGLWLVDASGQIKRIVESSAGNWLSWSPDGKRLPYSLTLSPAGNNLQSQSDALYSFDLSNGKTVQHILTPECGIQVASWWPDGRGIIFWSIPIYSQSLAADGTGLYSYRFGDKSPQLLSTGLVHRDWLSLAADGRLLYIAGSGRIAWTGKWLELCNVETGLLKKITPPQGNVILDPSFSPDGNMMAYVSAKDLGSEILGFPDARDLQKWIDSRTLWIATADGSGARSIAEAGPGIYQPEWSRDGSLLCMFPRTVFG
ncbi:MAG TPA: biopolymer transporter Tol [Syntrophomonadaceae bacterium]|nr:biopolymer transporter Tol [Syntrophomonadaceae bacterium]